MIKEQLEKKFDLIELMEATGRKVLKKENLHCIICPFCAGPFFYAHKQEQTWHCFHCGLGGGVAEFIQHYKKYEFESLALLCDFSEEQIFRAKNDYEVCVNLINEYQKFYTEKANKDFAHNYLLSRGISKETAEIFGIGYAPNNYFVQNSIPTEYHKKIFQKNSGGYLTFTERIMFPFYRMDGQIVGYSGRDTSKKDNVPKYLNTGNTPLFSKSKEAYGFFQAKKSIEESKKVILCEGQMDVLSWHEVGYTNTIGVSGTALSNYHIKILLQLGVEEFYLAFDFDEAGEKAKERAIEMLKPFGKKIYLLQKFSGEDIKDMNDILVKQELYNIDFTLYEQ